jgi:hypothetical protein
VEFGAENANPTTPIHDSAHGQARSGRNKRGSADAELVALGVEHDDVAEFVAVEVLADLGHPDVDMQAVLRGLGFRNLEAIWSPCRRR